MADTLSLSFIGGIATEMRNLTEFVDEIDAPTLQSGAKGVETYATLMASRYDMNEEQIRQSMAAAQPLDIGSPRSAENFATLINQTTKLQSELERFGSGGLNPQATEMFENARNSTTRLQEFMMEDFRLQHPEKARAYEALQQAHLKDEFFKTANEYIKPTQDIDNTTPNDPVREAMRLREKVQMQGEKLEPEFQRQLQNENAAIEGMRQSFFQLVDEMTEQRKQAPEGTGEPEAPTRTGLVR